jgi:hypothetical protein
MPARNLRTGVALAILVTLSGSVEAAERGGRVEPASVARSIEGLVPANLRMLLDKVFLLRPNGRKITPKCSVGIDPNGKPCP